MRRAVYYIKLVKQILYLHAAFKALQTLEKKKCGLIFCVVETIYSIVILTIVC